MKKIGLLNRDLSALVAAMGHYDRLVVSDAGFPIPLEMDYVDLSMGPNRPTVLEVIELLASELEVEEIYIAQEALDRMAGRLDELGVVYPGATRTAIPHAEFKAMAREARGVVRTGDFTPYGNVMLVSGVVY
jgi:D-ribose pyranase